MGTHGPGASSRSLILSSSSPRRVSRVVLLSHYYVAVAAALGMRLTNTYRGVPSTCTTSAATFRFRGKLLCGSTSSSPLCRFVELLLLCLFFFIYPRSPPAHCPWALDLAALLCTNLLYPSTFHFVDGGVQYGTVVSPIISYSPDEECFASVVTFAAFGIFFLGKS